jgi:hypothetical protein
VSNEYPSDFIFLAPLFYALFRDGAVPGRGRRHEAAVVADGTTGVTAGDAVVEESLEAKK